MPLTNIPQRLERHFPRAARFFVERLGPGEYLGVHLVVALAVAAILIAGFVLVADAFPEHGSLARIDSSVLVWLHAHGTEGGESVFNVISWIGSVGMTGIALVVGIVLTLRREWLRLTLLAGALGGGELLDIVLKAAFHRTRPPFASEFIHRQSWSFPSGHALNSVVGFGVLAFLLLLHVSGRAMRLAIITSTIVLVAAIGFSRLYLGVHYVSDVAAGFLGGGFWLVACVTGYDIAAAHRTSAKRTVTGPPRQTAS